VAVIRSRVVERSALDGNIFPIVAVRVQSEFQDPKAPDVTNFAVGFGIAKGPQVLTAGTDDKLADTALGIGSGVGFLWREALVIVVVAADDDIGVGVVKGLPERLDFEVISVRDAGTEERLVPYERVQAAWCAARSARSHFP